MNLLFTCAGRRRYLLGYFEEVLGKDDKIVATDMQLSAPALSVADYIEQVPSVYAEDYIDITLSICKKYQIDALISLNDLELPILASQKYRFEAIGVKVLISSIEVIDICFDKFKTAQYITSLGLNTPQTYISYDEAKSALKTGGLRFPLVLKPRWGSGSIGIEFVSDVEELEEVYALLRKKIQKSILATASVKDEYILIQEKIEGPEYGLDIMNDLEGNYRGVSVKKKMAMRAGETDKAVTVDNEEIRSIGAHIGRNLKHVANLDCDILMRDGKYYVLELNPRFGGGYPFSHEAGVNMPLAILSWLRGEKVHDKWLVPEYGKAFSKCDILIPIHS